MEAGRQSFGTGKMNGNFSQRGDNPYKELINTLSELDESGEAESYQELTDRSFKRFKEIAEQGLSKWRWRYFNCFPWNYH